MLVAVPPPPAEETPTYCVPPLETVVLVADPLPPTYCEPYAEIVVPSAVPSSSWTPYQIVVSLAVPR